jgi:hypothetical protein
LWTSLVVNFTCFQLITDNTTTAKPFIPKQVRID